MENKLLLVIFVTATICIIFSGYAYSCNEHVCASIVSKCMLTQSCKCDLKNCSCCKECFQCLSYLYPECCSCVEMCPKPNDTKNALSKQSHVGELSGISGLFQALTEEPDPDQKWTMFTFPVDLDAALYGAKLQPEFKLHLQSIDQQIEPIYVNKKDIVTVNCTVAYIAQCMPWNKCKDNCQSMGAESFRWFHDGCCECIGEHCLNYGINESRCISCPENKDDDFEDIPEDDLDYGENMSIDSSVDTNT